MSILLIGLLYIAPQPGFDCGPVSPLAGHFVPLGLTTPSTALAQARPMASRQFSSAPDAGDLPAVQSPASDANLQFYLDSHSQALSDNDAASMNPWVQLHPVGAAEGLPVLEVTLPEAGEQPAGHHGYGRFPEAGHACS